jgi:hypothetical protein
MVKVAAREKEIGLTGAVAAYDATAAAECDARLPLLLYLPADAEEARAKAAYVKKSAPFRDGWCSTDDGFMEAVIDRLCMAPMEGLQI